MKTDQPYSIELLKEAFSTFNETSERLTQVYQSLASRTSGFCSEINERGTQDVGARLEAMGGLVTKIVHDIRNPLGSIELISSLLRKELSQDADKQRLIDHILYGVKNIDNLLTNLLHFTHFPKPRLRTACLRAIVEKSLDVMSYVIGKNQITLIRDIPDDIEICCDESLMRQVFINLFLNSIQAISSGGNLSIQALKNGAEAEVCVKDSGCGISPENLDRIFNPFYTTKEKGTGLGLTIVHNIIRVHGGSIRAHSQLGEGTLFVVKIPANGLAGQ